MLLAERQESVKYQEMARPSQSDKSETKPEITLSLADLALFYRPESESYFDFLQGSGCSRIHIGSAFCAKYFLRSAGQFLPVMEDFLRQEGWKVTLTVPVLQEEMAEPVRRTIRRLLENDAGLIDEIVAHDYGMLHFLNQETAALAPECTLTAGRTFFRNYRDPRYPAFSEQEQKIVMPALLKPLVSAVELDSTGKWADCSAIPEDVNIHLHYPMTCITFSPACEFASVMHPVERKFRTALPCGISCMKAMLETEAAGQKFFHIGKGVYVDAGVAAFSGRQPDRFIYWPVQEFFQSDESVRVFV